MRIHLYIIFIAYSFCISSGCEDDKYNFNLTNCDTDFTGFPDIPGWSFSSIPISPSLLSIRHVHFFAEGKGLIITNSEIWLTENEGESWTKVQSAAFLRINDFSFIDQLHGFLVGEKDSENCILKTNDGGHTWTTILHQPEDEIDHFSFADSLKGIARFQSLTSFREFNAKTTNGGLTWVEIPGLSVSQTSLGEINMLPNGFGYISGKVNEIHLTHNFGDSWSTVFTIPNYLDIQFLNDSIAFAGDFDSLYKKGAPGKWIKISDHRTEWFHFFSPTDGISLQRLAINFADFGTIQCSAFLTTVDRGITWNEGPPSINFFMSDINFVNDHVGYGKTSIDEFRIVKIFR